jgi:hypothetical protein
MIEAFIDLDQAYADLDAAFQLNPRTQHQEFLARLDESVLQFDKAKIKARESAETWSKFIDNVSDLGVLWS